MAMKFYTLDEMKDKYVDEYEKSNEMSRSFKKVIKNVENALEIVGDAREKGQLNGKMTGTAADNFLDAGRTADWGSHRIEHELSAEYGITHGEGMAVVLVAWTKYIAHIKPWRLALLANRVFGVDSYDYSEEDRALILSDKLREFFSELGLATSLKELKIDDSRFERIAARATRNGTVGHYVPLDAKKIVDILKS